VKDLLPLSQAKLVEVLGHLLGKKLYSFARGIDNAPVVPTLKEKSMSQEDSFMSCTHSQGVALKLSTILPPLLKRIDKRFEIHGDLPSLIRLTIREWRGDRYGLKRRRTSKQQIVEINTFHPNDEKREEKILAMLMEIFFKMIPKNQSYNLTLLNVGVTSFKAYGGAGKLGKQIGIKTFMMPGVKSSSFAPTIFDEGSRLGHSQATTEFGQNAIKRVHRTNERKSAPAKIALSSSEVTSSNQSSHDLSTRKRIRQSQLNVLNLDTKSLALHAGEGSDHNTSPKRRSLDALSSLKKACIKSSECSGISVGNFNSLRKCSTSSDQISEEDIDAMFGMS